MSYDAFRERTLLDNLADVFGALLTAGLYDRETNRAIRDADLDYEPGDH